MVDAKMVIHSLILLSVKGRIYDLPLNLSNFCDYFNTPIYNTSDTGIILDPGLKETGTFWFLSLGISNLGSGSGKLKVGCHAHRQPEWRGFKQEGGFLG